MSRLTSRAVRYSRGRRSLLRARRGGAVPFFVGGGVSGFGGLGLRGMGAGGGHEPVDLPGGQVLARPALAVASPSRRDCPIFGGWGGLGLGRFGLARHGAGRPHCPVMGPTRDSWRRAPVSGNGRRSEVD